MEKSALFVFPANVTADLNLNVKSARVLRSAVTKVTFTPEYRLPSGRVLTNVAVLQLAGQYFVSP